MPDVDERLHRRRNLLATAVTLLVLTGVCVFAWRVYHYASLIQSGTLTTSDLRFLQHYTSSTSLAVQPIPTGSFDTVTADDPSLGSKQAPLTIVEFADFQCPFSRDESQVIRSIAAAHPNEVRFIFRDFPIIELHPNAERAAEAADCADDQGLFWEYHDKLFANQNALDDDSLVEYASELNLNVGEFKRCLTGGRKAAEVAADEDAGIQAGVRGTPTFFVKGNRIPGAIPEDIFLKLIAANAT